MGSGYVNLRKRKKRQQRKVGHEEAAHRPSRMHPAKQFDQRLCSTKELEKRQMEGRTGRWRSSKEGMPKKNKKFS